MPVELILRDRGDVLDQHRIAAALGQHGVAEVVDRADEPDAAHHRGLRPDVHGIAADVDVAVVERLQELRQREPVGDELVEVDLQLVGLGLAAPADHVDHAGDRTETALQHPVLQRLEVEHAVIGRAGQLVAVDLADRRDRRDLRLRVVEERRQRGEAVEHLLERLFVGVVERELQLHVREAVERYRAHDAQVLDRRGLRLDRDGDVALDLLRRETRALRDDVDHRRRRVGIGLDVELAKCEEAADEHDDAEREHQHAVLQGEGNQRVHGVVARLSPRMPRRALSSRWRRGR